MNNETTTTIDVANGTQIERPLNEQELAQRELDQTAAQARIDAQAVKLAARQAVLNKLELTSDEAAALFG